MKGRTSEPVGAMGVPTLARTTSLSVLARLALTGGGPLGEEGEASAALARALTTGAGPLVGEDGTTLGLF